MFEFEEMWMSPMESALMRLIFLGQSLPAKAITASYKELYKLLPDLPMVRESAIHAALLELQVEDHITFDDDRWRLWALSVADQRQLLNQSDLNVYKKALLSAYNKEPMMFVGDLSFEHPAAQDFFLFDMQEALFNNNIDQLNKLITAKWEGASEIWKGTVTQLALSLWHEADDIDNCLLEFLMPVSLEKGFAVAVDVDELLFKCLDYLEDDNLMDMPDKMALALLNMGLWCGERELIEGVRENTSGRFDKICTALKAALQGDWSRCDSDALVELTGATKIKHNTRKLGFEAQLLLGFLLIKLTAVKKGVSFEAWMRSLGAQGEQIVRVVDQSLGLSLERLFGFVSGAYQSFDKLSMIAEGNLFQYFVRALEVLFVTPSMADVSVVVTVRNLLGKTSGAGYHFMTASLIPCIMHLNQHNDIISLAEDDVIDKGLQPLWSLQPKLINWEAALDELEALLKGNSGKNRDDGEQDKRLLWLLAIGNKAHGTDKPEEWGSIVFKIDILAQKKSKRGGWSSGRALEIDKIFGSSLDDYMDEADLRARDALAHRQELDFYGCYTYCDLTLAEKEKLLRALVGHPRLYAVLDQDARVWRYNHLKEFERLPMKMELGEAVVEVYADQEGASLKANWPFRTHYDSIAIRQEHATHYTLFERNRKLTELEAVLKLHAQQDGITVPPAGAERFKKLLPLLAEQVDMVGDFEGELISRRIVDGGVKLRMLAHMVNDEMHFDLRSQPVLDIDTLVAPGKGAGKLMARDNGEAVVISRNMEAEKSQRKTLLESVPSLEEWEIMENHWEVHDFENMLSVLNELYQQATLASLEWPEGGALSVFRPGAQGAFNITASKGKDFWLSIGGDVALDNGKVIKFNEILRNINSRFGNFIRLDENQFLRLSNSLIRKIEALTNAGDNSRDKLSLPPSAIQLLSDLETEKEQFTLPLLVREQIADFRRAFRLEPKVPTSMTCTLRPYQLDGFIWLYRLASCNLGACLADDMGLGKTIQLLALLTARAAEGASLVIAPTSVSHNWQAEALRFAPALRFMQLNEVENRLAIVTAAQPYDVIVCSYGLLTFEDDAITSRKWNIVVLDEAQAVKNRTIRRTRVVKRLESKMRVIATGTPVENNLSELWNLFDFINPGLLGSHAQFKRRFLSSDNKVHPALKRLTAPFILRRTKSSVLDDLPPKTEIQLTVTLNDDERALYESCRQQALSALSDVDASDRITILSQLTRLRRVCCHPSLLVPDTTMPGQKVENFISLVGDLCANNHRALVFSQFVDFLSIIRKRLDAEGISYQYLDGSTPMSKRGDIVKRFQQGEGNLFLISLKAGGTGLNLTAANYVILLDPWWNPAVEMQATDRAHRIGQCNPVTVYRLITADTVEERVVQLHSSKLSLAQDILADTADTKLSVNELLSLFTE